MILLELKAPVTQAYGVHHIGHYQYMIPQLPVAGVLVGLVPVAWVLQSRLISWNGSVSPGKPRKEYFLEYKKDGSHPPCIDLATALHGFGIDNTAAHHAIEYMHVDGKQKMVFTVLRGRLCLMYVMHLLTMTMLPPLAPMPNRDGGTGMKTMLWDINVIPN